MARSPAKRAKPTSKRDGALAEITTRARRKDLAARDLQEIRDRIADLEALNLGDLIEDRVTRTARRNLKIADTQLRDILKRIKNGNIDEEAFADLPDHLKKQILTRLENNITRMRRALAADDDEDKDYASPAFKCIEDYEKCKGRAPGSPIWCHIAMTVCQIRALTTFARALSGTNK